MASNYKITGQKQDVQINPAGSGFVNVWDIGVNVTSGPSRGANFTVTVPESDHNAQYVGQAIEDKIATLDEVSSLGDTQ